MGKQSAHGPSFASAGLIETLDCVTVLTPDLCEHTGVEGNRPACRGPGILSGDRTPCGAAGHSAEQDPFPSIIFQNNCSYLRPNLSYLISFCRHFRLLAMAPCCTFWLSLNLGGGLGLGVLWFGRLRFSRFRRGAGLGVFRICR